MSFNFKEYRALNKCLGFFAYILKAVSLEWVSLKWTTITIDLHNIVVAGGVEPGRGLEVESERNSGQYPAGND